MTSVCTGSLVYAAAGLLRGRPATTHWRSLDALAELDPTIDVRRQDQVLEIGFGPGVAIEMLAARAAHVAGVDPSVELLRQATRRNAAAISDGRVELRRCSADDMPFVDGNFDKALAINSMQLWPDKLAGLRELSRVLRHDGQIAMAFTAYSGQQREGVTELIAEAGFSDCRVVETEQAFCVPASASSRT